MSNSVAAYNAKYTQILGDKKSEIPRYEYPIRFGIELEYEVNTPANIANKNKETQHLYRSQIADRVEHTYKEFAFAKHDGSLTNGFEVVSMPMSIDAHTTQWLPFFAIARENGLQIRSTCGMHVHVSREYLSPLQIGKIMAFIFNPKHAEFIRSIAGRKPPIIHGKHYAEMAPKKITDVNRHRERYSALNLTNPETIEFRMFKGTLNIHHMMKNIEFCSALVCLTWPGCNASIRDIRTNGLRLFFDFVAEVTNRKRFPHLADFMKSQGYIDWKVKKPFKSGELKDKIEKVKPVKKVTKRGRLLTKVKGKLIKKDVTDKWSDNFDSELETPPIAPSFDLNALITMGDNDNDDDEYYADEDED